MPGIHLRLRRFVRKLCSIVVPTGCSPAHNLLWVARVPRTCSVPISALSSTHENTSADGSVLSLIGKRPEGPISGWLSRVLVDAHGPLHITSFMAKWVLELCGVVHKDFHVIGMPSPQCRQKTEHKTGEQRFCTVRLHFGRFFTLRMFGSNLAGLCPGGRFFLTIAHTPTRGGGGRVDALPPEPSPQRADPRRPIRCPAP